VKKFNNEKRNTQQEEDSEREQYVRRDRIEVQAYLKKRTKIHIEVAIPSKKNSVEKKTNCETADNQNGAVDVLILKSGASGSGSGVVPFIFTAKSMLSEAHVPS